MLELYVWIKSLFASEEGQDLVEYAVLLALIALVVWLAVSYAGLTVNNIWVTIQTKLGEIQ